ncbi:3-deoxy-7-phosphoheptulonate synthase [Couchioplanes azureus]|uniref:3-deoxy-7-phosphoheptulonate synthase n=1 Tax=Couchioplanes caeruleus TaxID=56438 RepID=UPI0019B95572|nr:3-deoxy-7-phosphoheptulonate synthase [Couchioplanes caeruleus]GGQ43741.1 phospho-2-dehydro-3-deoxyheptonate aldolase [Couchioplanes caeruleus subsp. azureus]
MTTPLTLIPFDDTDFTSDPEREGRWLRTLPARQQPRWKDRWQAERLSGELGDLPGLVAWEEVRQLRLLLAEVAAGGLQVLQAGDCAEDPADCVPEVLSRKAGMLDALAGVMQARTGLPVVRVGRIAGQFAKPRSADLERHGELELPAFRGHLVNDPRPDPQLRQPDPARLLTGYRAARAGTEFLRRLAGAWDLPAGAPVWTSHEALVLDYELPLLRRGPRGLLLTSTHWPWIGDRTRQPDGAHVQLLARIQNPVACKVGPTTTPAELIRLCGVLDPARSPGRLTLISRMGAERVAEWLPPLMAAVRDAGHPVVWLCDPMHGNTRRGPLGRKTRLLTSVVREVELFQEVAGAEQAVAGGLHLEATPENVGECVADESHLDDLLDPLRYTTLCDPRLNIGQAVAVVSAWRR